MLALERHIGQPLNRQQQFEDASRYTNAASLINRIKATNDAHIATLERRLEALGGHAASPIKSGWSALLGVGAAAIDSVRKTKISKSLRDDYTALNLAAMGYTMLNATALGMGDAASASMAKQCLGDYAKIIVEIVQAMPDVVLQELVDTGVSVAPMAADQARRDTDECWRTSSPQYETQVTSTVSTTFGGSA
ncbi:MAG: hypothetical protein JO060_05255 [Candidatus Eremiobacteraeota bacterium]|nr:hypothetical protein [Candidatus Eremiobacteraeota bacterium]